MAPRHPQRGRVYRRCGCRDASGRQYGARCPKLNSRHRHGSWAYALDVPSASGRRSTRCRSGFVTQAAAHAALDRAVEAERTGIYADDQLTVARYLIDWLATKEEVLKPTAYARYRDHIRGDLIPVFGRLKLSDLRFRHIAGWVEAELTRGRGRTSVYRSNATLSSALSHAVRTRLLADIPARFAFMPRPVSPERLCWTPSAGRDLPSAQH